MKYVFVGDIHGKVEEVERALSLDGHVIFVGDFIDSFDRKPAAHAKCYELVLEAIKQGKAEAIYGNHELSYLKSAQHRCSGWSNARAEVVMSFANDIRELFEPYILLKPDFLVTHAGLTKQLWDKYNLSLETLDQTLTDWWLDIRSPGHGIGYYRGGNVSVGGIFWCDFNVEFQPIPGLTQVFGHTAGPTIRQIENSYCIDCLDHEHKFLEMDL